jgi:outer membrane protein insertion porin family
MIWLLLLLMCGFGAGIPSTFAQSSHPHKPAARVNRWPVKSLSVEGNRNYTQAQVLVVAGLKIGQMAGKEDFEAARDRLVATGVFETVGYKFAPAESGNAYEVSFQVVEVEPAYPLQFEELGVPDQDVNAYLRGKDPLFAPRLPATKALLERYRVLVQECLTAHHSQEKVLSKITPTGPDKFVILFRPARPDPAVAQVSFEGNQVIPSTALQNAIAEVAVGAPYREDRFRQYLDAAIRPLYDARGRIRVAFPKVTAEKASDVQGVAVKVMVDEGASYDLGNVRIEGAPNFESERLFKTAKFKPGDLANFDEVSKSVDRIKKLLSRQGYMRSDVQIVRKIDDAKRRVDLVLHIDQGPQFLFRTLHIEGLDLEGEAAIKKMWTLREGTPYNPEYPDYVLNRVHSEGIFDNLGETHSDTKVDDQTHTVEVTLYFKYAPAPVKRIEPPLSSGPGG